jgi:hypothetical protein
VVRSNRKLRRAADGVVRRSLPPRDLADKQPHDENCLCEDCEGRRWWPQGYVGSLGRSFDCVDVHRWSWGPELTRWGEDRAGKDGKKPTKREAIQAGLHVKRSRAGAPQVIQIMRQGCAGVEPDGSPCLNLKPTTEKFCSDCRKKEIQRLEEEGYFR